MRVKQWYRYLVYLWIVYILSGVTILYAQDDWEAMISLSGEVKLFCNGKSQAEIKPVLYVPYWKWAAFGPRKKEGETPDVLKGVLKPPGWGVVNTELRARKIESGVRLEYCFIPEKDIRTNSMHILIKFPIKIIAGGNFEVNGKVYSFPEKFKDIHLWSGDAKSLQVTTAQGKAFNINVLSPSQVLFQDSRKWGPEQIIRIGCLKDTKWTAGGKYNVSFDITADEGIKMDVDTPVEITAGPEWIPLEVDLTIKPGSVLDFSQMGFHDTPAGKFGRIVIGADGQFVFEEQPDRPLRFYGVNLCYSANFVTHEQADRLTERLSRLGYNALRIHHHESELVKPSSGFDFIDTSQAPSRVQSLSLFEAPSLQGDKYASRIRGILHPEVNGEYTFWISADDGGTLWLSSDENPVNKKMIAKASGWTGKREWEKFPEQKSSPIHLQAGKKYYIETLHREGILNDHLAVSWQPPDGEREIIPGKYLSKLENMDMKGEVVWEFWKDREMTGSTEIQPEVMDKLDYLISACKKRGIYVTTDLFVSRPVLAREIWPRANGYIQMNTYKMLVPVNERAFNNWKEFVRNFLTHKNPYTGLTYAEDPTLAWLSMINEGNFGNFIGRLEYRVKVYWRRAWNKFLAERYSSMDELMERWGKKIKGNFESGTVPLFTEIYEDSPQGRDLAAFLAVTEADMFSRMTKFLRQDLKCDALFTNMNGWTNRVSTQAARTEYDYVDEHFYVDHPRFLRRNWQLPSRSANRSPIADGGPGGRHCAFVRLFDKPFTISEYNYVGPGRFRGVGGILTGCLGAIQDWNVIWRFTYSHSRDKLFRPSPIGYFDICSDPLNQAADRAAVCLYLRRDMSPAPHSVAIAMDSDSLKSGKTTNRAVSPDWNALALITRVGTCLAGENKNVSADIVLPFGDVKFTSEEGDVLDLVPYATDTGEKIISAMRKKGWMRKNVTDLKKNRIQSETNELFIDADTDIMTISTERTSGGYAPEGKTIDAGDVVIHMDKTYGTVWVSSVDGEPIRSSRRLVLTHLTDLQNSGIKFGDKTRQTLNAWGALPHLVRNGAATVRIKMDDPESAEVWDLTTGGKRVTRHPVKVENGELIIHTSVLNKAGKARMLYEIHIP